MARVVGTPRKIQIGGQTIVCPADVDMKFWAGGPKVTAMLEDNNGATPQVQFTSGRLTGVTARVFTTDGSLTTFMDLVRRSGQGEELPTLVELADGGKWSAPCFIMVSDEGPYSTNDGSFTYDIVAAKSANGEFKKV